MTSEVKLIALKVQNKSLVFLTKSALPLWGTVAQTLLQVAAFIALMLIAGRRILPWLLWEVARTGSRELFTLSVVAVAIGIAYGAAALIGVSIAQGAFFAGMVMRESEFTHRAGRESRCRWATHSRRFSLLPPACCSSQW